MRASVPIHCSKSRQRPRPIENVHICGITYSEVFESTAPDDFPLRRLCARAKDFLLLLVLSLNFASVTDSSQRLLAELGVGDVETERLKDRELLVMVCFQCSSPVIWQETSYFKDVPVAHIPRLRYPFNTLSSSPSAQDCFSSPPSAGSSREAGCSRRLHFLLYLPSPVVFFL
jgi:hypothetical protein